jgi:hypothetical protein
MPPVDVSRSHHLSSDAVKMQSFCDQSLEAASSTSAAAYRGKDTGAAGGFENIMKGRYSSIGRGGSVGDELVRTDSRGLAHVKAITQLAATS